MEKLIAKNGFDEKVKEAAYWVADVLMRDNKNYKDEEVDNNFVLAAYLIYRLKLSGKPQDMPLEQVVEELKLPEKMRTEVLKRFSKVFWNVCMSRVHGYDAEVIKELIDNYSQYIRLRAEDITPASVAALAMKLLKVGSGDRVADICSGSGNFLMQAAEANVAQCHGFELSAPAIERCQLRAEINNKQLTIEQADATELLCNKDKATLPQFDKIFSQVPLGNKREALARLNAADLGEFSWILKKGSSYSWAIAYLAMQMLAPRGKAVIIMENAACYNKLDKGIREYFLNQGWVEAVIALPNRLVTESALGMSMLVLSRGNKKVRMVDAENLYQKGRRQNELSEVNIFEIWRRCTIDTEESMLVTKEALLENDLILSPNRYLSPVAQFENGVKLDKLVVRIKRSAPFTARQLDGLDTEENTGLRCIRLTDIQDGVVQANPAFMKPINRKYDQYLLADDDLVISKFGLPSKLALVKVNPGEEWVMVGNMYALEFDKTKVNPYYVKAFFDSEAGIKALSSVITDASVPVLSLDLLKTLQIPVPSMEEQNRVAAKYKAGAEKVRELRGKLQEAMDELGKVFDLETK